MDKLASAEIGRVSLILHYFLFYKAKGAIVIAQDFPYKYLPARSIKRFLSANLLNEIHSRSFRRAAHTFAISDYTKKRCHKIFEFPNQR